MRFDGTDTSLMALEPDDGSNDFEKSFKTAYKQEFGFLLESKNIIIDDIKVRISEVQFVKEHTHQCCVG